MSDEEIKVVWCPRCPSVVQKQDDGAWKCAGCGAEWDADRKRVNHTVGGQR